MTEKFKNFVQIASEKIIYILHRRYVPAVIYALLVILATVNVSRNGGNFSYLFFYAVILYLPLSIIYLLYTIITLKTYQETENKLIQKNTAEKYQFVMENAGYLPIGEVRFYYDQDISHFAEEFTEKTYKLLPREKVEIDTEIFCHFAGNYDTGIVGYYIQDLFGIVRLRKRVMIPVRDHILPIITDVAQKGIEELTDSRKNGNLFSLNIPENHLGNDIRKYAEGDSLNTIHWKLFAKTGDMYVRLPEQQESKMLCMVLATELMDGSLESIERRDKFLEYLVSIGEFFGMKQKPLMLCYYNIGVKTFIIDSPDSFMEFYSEIIAQIGNKNAGEHSEEMVEEVTRKYGNVVILREDTLAVENL